MFRDSHNIFPASLAALLHVLILGSMIVAYDLARPTPFTPLAVQATLVTEIPEVTPPRVAEPEPEPQPVVEEPEPELEPEPVVEEPEPDNSEELRRQAEEEKRRLDALLEKERLEKIRQQEEAERKKQEKEEAERKKQEKEEAERKKREEEEKERKRIEAEKQREEDIRRQREENERLRREMETEQRQDEIDAESERLAAIDSGQLAVYQAMIQQKIYRNWKVPASAQDDLFCSVRVRQARGGDVLGVSFVRCNGDEAVKRSIEAAILRSSPLPDPPEPNLFDPNILLNLSKQQ
ncbi:MAG: cell envelope integrity protein TolA [Gammaproteobacteria bacterium]|nr:cell envelope integrity protein TolA [Gammaproteobacteria bacterium]MDH3576297.1 cell envelope integrity protein TolA [Gammaproteobacteria bacterium]